MLCWLAFLRPSPPRGNESCAPQLGIRVRSARILHCSSFYIASFHSRGRRRPTVSRTPIGNSGFILRRATTPCSNPPFSPGNLLTFLFDHQRYYDLRCGDRSGDIKRVDLNVTFLLVLFRDKSESNIYVKRRARSGS